MGKKITSFHVGRRADDGKFATISYAKAHPKTTVVETIKREEKKK